MYDKSADCELNHMKLNKSTKYNFVGGDYNWVDATEGTEQFRRAVDIQIHPNFDPDLLLNDIAIIYLDKPMQLNTYVQPACMPHVNVDGGSGAGAGGASSG